MNIKIIQSNLCDIFQTFHHVNGIWQLVEVPLWNLQVVNPHKLKMFCFLSACSKTKTCIYACKLHAYHWFTENHWCYCGPIVPIGYPHFSHRYTTTSIQFTVCFSWPQRSKDTIFGSSPWLSRLKYLHNHGCRRFYEKSAF